MQLTLSYTYRGLSFEDVVDAYWACREKYSSTFSEVPGTHFECLTSYPVPRAIAPLLPWLKAIDLQEIGKVDRETRMLHCVVLNECSRTHMTIQPDEHGNTIARATANIDTSGWNKLVIAAAPAISREQFRIQREKEAKLARRTAAAR